MITFRLFRRYFAFAMSLAMMPMAMLLCAAMLFERRRCHARHLRRDAFRHTPLVIFAFSIHDAAAA